MFNSAPGHLGDVKQSICAAKIDKCAEISYVLNNAFNDIAFFDLLKEFLLQFSLLGYDQLFTVADISSSLGIVLADHEFNLLSCILGQILLISIGYQACGDEDSYFVHNYT